VQRLLSYQNDFLISVLNFYFMDIVSILWALVSLCITVAIIYLIIWVLRKFGIMIPATILRIIWVIIVLLAIIWIIEHFFTGRSGIVIHHRR
jgi:hypothetical protein